MTEVNIEQSRSQLLTNSFKEGMKVAYVPYHAKGDTNHEDCEMGIVTYSNEEVVFVKFGTGSVSQACYADTLVKR